MSKRLHAMGAARYARGFELALHEDALEAPLRWRASCKVFVNSMSGLFHKEVPVEFIRRVFDVIRRCPQHQFQILTKRARRLRILAELARSNGPRTRGSVSTSRIRSARRRAVLTAVPAAVRFLSVEPLLGPIHDLPLDGIHWVIVGGESGPRARPMHPDWVESIRRQC
jgi:protein gp37